MRCSPPRDGVGSLPSILAENRNITMPVDKSSSTTLLQTKVCCLSEGWCVRYSSYE